jgi:hypothetical protein
MKRVAVFGSIAEFESFVNDPKVSVIQVTVNSCQQSYNFQECFIGVVFYEDAPLNTAESPATDRQHTQAKMPSWGEVTVGVKFATRGERDVAADIYSTIARHFGCA